MSSFDNPFTVAFNSNSFPLPVSLHSAPDIYPNSFFASNATSRHATMSTINDDCLSGSGVMTSLAEGKDGSFNNITANQFIVIY